ncbi:MAG: tetratricopeptide repeat protein [Elusimicrobia bacterium]|nr:tetratricopeptide repeat protein [Elusimicrobiota bacterium]
MSSVRRSHLVLVAAAAAGVYLMTLWTQGFIRDDRWLIAGNHLLSQGLGGVTHILSSGYVEMVMGSQAPIQEYRPLLTLTFLLHFLTTGATPWPMHAVNILLHATACCLLLAALRRRMTAAAALAAALLFAVMPVHAEVVSYITSRSELLVAVCVLGAWLLLERETHGLRLAAGTALFCVGLLSKEHAIVFPVFLALGDWTFHGQTPWRAGRLRVHLALAVCAAAYLLLRRLVLSHPLHGGVPYFPDRTTAWLTFSRFALAHYLWPSLSGTGLCADFSRPLVPDARPEAWSAWLAPAVWVALGATAARAVARRRAWGFWVLGPALFLLPTCHLLFPLDTLGAERLLYLPTVGLAALLGGACHRLQERSPLLGQSVLAMAALWYAGATIARNRAWLSELAYYQAAVSCNPVSARSRAALGTSRIEKGDLEQGEADLLAAVALDPRLPQSYYNLGRLAWERGDLDRAQRFSQRTLELDASASDAKVLLALCLERRGQFAPAAQLLENVLAAMPWHTEALFNLGRLELLRGRPALARPLFARFAQLAPDDPDAPQARALAAP